MRVDQLRLQALRYVVLGDSARALELLHAIVRALPDDLDTRMRIADTLVSIGARPLAKRVYAAVAYCDIQGGRPLHALVPIQALSDLGEDVRALRRGLAQIYCAGSPRIGKGGRLSPPPDDTEVSPPDLERAAPLEEVAARAADIAADLTSIARFPDQFPPLPLLSELSEEALAGLLDMAVVRRLGQGTTVIRKGDTGDSFFFVASGTLRVYTTDAQGQETELARLHEGSLFGEMALVAAQPRAATVDVVGAADVIEFGRGALVAAGDELRAIAATLERFARERLLKNLLARSPLFQLFSAPERHALVGRFTVREVGHDIEILRAGEKATELYMVLTGEMGLFEGEEPFDTRVITLRAGDCFGAASLLHGDAVPLTLRSISPAIILCLPEHYFRRLALTVPEAHALFAQGVSRPRRSADEPLVL